MFIMINMHIIVTLQMMTKFDTRGRNTLNFLDFLDFMSHMEKDTTDQRENTTAALEHFQYAA